MQYLKLCRPDQLINSQSQQGQNKWSVKGCKLDGVDITQLVHQEKQLIIISFIKHETGFC